MTNEQGECFSRHSDFVIPLSFVIRHSSFVEALIHSYGSLVSPKIGSGSRCSAKHFATGQLGRTGRLFDSRECALFQTFPKATVSSRIDHPQLESDGGTGGQQDGFQSAAGDRRVRPGGRGAFARDRPAHESGFAITPV